HHLNTDLCADTRRLLYAVRVSCAAGPRTGERLIWKTGVKGEAIFVRSIAPRSSTPGSSAIRAWSGLGLSHLIGRAATTMNHSDIRGSGPHDHDSSGAASL